MPIPRISLIVVCSKNRVIGNHGEIPWHLPDDFRRFKARTTGHALIMGRKTYDSIGRPLPDRTNIIISRQAGLNIPGCTVVGSLAKALEKAKKTEKEEIFIGGGGQIYTEVLPLANRLYITKVEAIIEGDVFFPEYEGVFTRVLEKEKAEDGGYHLTYLTLEKA